MADSLWNICKRVRLKRSGFKSEVLGLGLLRANLRKAQGWVYVSFPLYETCGWNLRLDYDLQAGQICSETSAQIWLPKTTNTARRH